MHDTAAIEAADGDLGERIEYVVQGQVGHHPNNFWRELARHKDFDDAREEKEAYVAYPGYWMRLRIVEEVICSGVILSESWERPRT